MKVMQKEIITYEKIMEKADEVFEKDYSTGQFCHKQSFIWGFQEGADCVLEAIQKKHGLTFTPILRLLEMIEPEKWQSSNRGNGYAEKLMNKLKELGYEADAKCLQDKVDWLNGKPVAMATMDNDDSYAEQIIQYANAYSELTK